MNPAQAIQDHLGGTRASVAAIVDETPQAWGRYCNGHRSPSAGKVAAWCKWAKVRLIVTAPGEWRAVDR